MGDEAISPFDPRSALLDALDSLDIFRAIAANARTPSAREAAADNLNVAIHDLLWFLEYQRLVDEGTTAEDAAREADTLWKRRLRAAMRRRRTDLAG